jgi:hypothetical protein
MDVKKNFGFAFTIWLYSIHRLLTDHQIEPDVVRYLRVKSGATAYQKRTGQIQMRSKIIATICECKLLLDKSITKPKFGDNSIFGHFVGFRCIA